MSKKLFVGNIDWNTSEEDLQALFSKCGVVEEAVIIKDKMTNRPKGFGFVSFSNEDEAKEAIAKLNDQELNGRKLVVNEARPPKQYNNNNRY